MPFKRQAAPGTQPIGVAGHVQRYCGNTCRGLSRRIERRVRRPSTAVCRRCGDLFKVTHHGQLLCSHACRSVASTKYRCIACGCEYDYHPTGGRPKLTCSEACKRRLERVRKRTSKSRRLRRTHVVEIVDPFQVFARDGWHCQLCGCKTPAQLRGTLDARAPELDHIVPIAVGGEHSYRNTQCSCRACNQKKGARPAGQMRLFG